MREQYDAPCGIYCGACFVMMARKRNNLASIARMWNYKPEQLICYGCRSARVSESCKPCKIRPCAESRGYQFCIECEDFPCELIKAFSKYKTQKPHGALIFKDLEEIKAKGLDAWLDKQASRWSCKECGTSFSWYDEICEKCGAKLYNAKEEASDLGLLSKEE